MNSIPYNLNYQVTILVLPSYTLLSVFVIFHSLSSDFMHQVFSLFFINLLLSQYGFHIQQSP